MKQMKSYFGICLCVYLVAFFCSISALSAVPSSLEQIQFSVIEGSVSNLFILGNEIESLWTNDEALYFQYYNRIGEVLEALSRTNSTALQLLEKQSEKALNRKCPTNPAVAISCFGSKFQIAERLMRISATPNDQHAENLAAFLGEVRTMIVTNYQRAQVFRNVTPPIVTTNNSRIGFFSGMDPKVISDTKARVAYEQAIAENNQRSYANDLQLNLLPEINKTMTRHFLNYVRLLLTQNPEANKRANSLAASAHLTDEERRQIK